MKQTGIALRLLLFMTVLTGLAYPLIVTIVSRVIFPTQASGSLIRFEGRTVGSELIGQVFTSNGYFESRPSAIEYGPIPSGGSNLGPTSANLKTQVEDRLARLAERNLSQVRPPQDLLFASGSGLDPHITPEAALYQTARIARERGLEVSAMRHLVSDMTELRQFGILGEPRVNVLKLNLALDRISKE